MQAPVQYGRLVSCFETSSGENCCLIQAFEMMETAQGTIQNEQNCPALDFLMVVPSSSIRSRAAMVHECSGDCSFTHATRPRVVEREEVELETGLTFVHDYSNNLYCLNIYCM